ncbi:hypothetical protein niasHS_015930 [Heterodera schachtii]|uniref:BUD13 homolog n=1 Tax=Heterodera schachtii TaxID=97005 RepID=A0ABD2HSG2_HETSC
MADSTSISASSRADYLKRYMTDEKKKKKSTKEQKSGKSGGMRLLDDEDTFIRTPHAKPSKFDEDDDDEIEEDDELMDDIDRNLIALKRKGKEMAGPNFKTDSFVTVEGALSDDDIKKEPLSPAHLEADEERGKSRSKEKKRRTKDTTLAKHEIKEEETNEMPTIAKKRRMDNGGRAGLLSKEAMEREERELRERDLQRLNELEASTAESGRDAETRKRETGFERRRRGEKRETAEDAARKEREAVKQKEMEAKYSLWNRGVAQAEERDAKLQEMGKVLDEGFARYADDEAMNARLKEQLHEEDPMAEYFRVKSHKVQMRTGVVFPAYKGQFPPNRFSIAPGYRWDGVNRSNGFESKLQLEKNKRKARETDTYRSIAECED